MAHRTLADFLEELGRAGELAPVDAEVDPCLEVAEITRRVARQAGPALLFRSVKGHDIPLLTNLLGSESRICRALGVETIEEAIGRIDRVLNSSGGEGWLERLRIGSKAGAVANFAANRVKSGACQQIVRLGGDVRSGRTSLPAARRGSQDAGNPFGDGPLRRSRTRTPRSFCRATCRSPAAIGWLPPGRTLPRWSP